MVVAWPNLSRYAATTDALSTMGARISISPLERRLINVHHSTGSRWRSFSGVSSTTWHSTLAPEMPS
eukprot:12284829-Prorocentrum_lima.AAC.1